MTRLGDELRADVARGRWRNLRPVPVVDCARCGGRGYVAVAVAVGTPDMSYCDCDAGAGRRARDARDAAQVREELRAAAETRFRRTCAFSPIEAGYALATYPDRQAEHYLTALVFLDEFDWTQNLILRGGVGVGKTSLAVSLVKELHARTQADKAFTTGRTIFYLTAIRLYDALHVAIREQRLEAEMQRFIDCDLLVLDDIGKERQTDWTQERLFQILDERYRHRRATWMTTNLRPELLAAWFDPAVYSRLMQYGMVIACDGEDLRLRDDDDER